MKDSLILITFYCLFFFSCSTNHQKKPDRIEISIIQSYGAEELFPTLLRLNDCISKSMKDSVLRHSSGIALLDKMKKDTSLKEKDNKLDYPLWNVLHPNTYYQNGKNYIYKSTILGISTIGDTAMTLQYLRRKEVTIKMPEDINYRFAIVLKGYLNVHVVHKNAKEITVNESDISKIKLVKFNTLTLLGSSDNERFELYILLDRRFSINLVSAYYTLFLKINDKIYSGSIIKQKRNDLILVGSLDMDEAEILIKKFKKKVTIESLH